MMYIKGNTVPKGYLLIDLGQDTRLEVLYLTSMCTIYESC